MKANTSGSVLPLGIFGLLAAQATMNRMAEELRARSGEISETELSSVARYLRGGRILFAIMEYTTDVVGGQFGTPGGSAIQTDGVNYWRTDAADYVERYGIGLPREFLEQARRAEWRTPTVSDEVASALDAWLYANIRRTNK